MPIDLGLARISKLLKHLGNPHNTYPSVHVAGTNGKGSTLAYLSSILTQARIRNGKFTSPHLISYNDCVTINNQTYPSKSFNKVIEEVRNFNSIQDLGCTEFEILTATAFRIFEIEKVELALVEVGVGGRLDATNVLSPFTHDGRGVIVSGITKIAMDHEGLLGDNLTSIAREKAGIIKNQTPVVVDSTNSPEVLEVIKKKANLEDASVDLSNLDLARFLLHHSPLLGEFQAQNLSVALGIILNLKLRSGEMKLTEDVILSGIEKTTWPGRLQKLRDSLTQIEFILDGAHNESAATQLDTFLEQTRPNGIIFVMALSKGKPIQKFISKLTRKASDAILPVTFTQPDNMPWVESYGVAELTEAARPLVDEIIEARTTSPCQIFDHLLRMRQKGDTRPIVVCGSLYLCSDILRHLREQDERESMLGSESNIKKP